MHNRQNTRNHTNECGVVYIRRKKKQNQKNSRKIVRIPMSIFSHRWDRNLCFDAYNLICCLSSVHNQIAQFILTISYSLHYVFALIYKSF